MSKHIVVIGLLAVLLSGCVTTSDQPRRKTNPDEARDAYIQLGLGYLQKGETERAKAPLSEALKIDSRSESAHVALALVFQQEGENKSAEKHFRAALASAPNNARILNNYGAFLMEQQRHGEALEYFRKASEDTLYAERSRVFENLGLAYRSLGSTDEARASFERALRLNSRQPLALLELAQMEFEAQNFVPAWNYYLGFTQMAPQSASSLWLGVQLARRFNDHNRAASYALQLRRLYPATPEARALLESESS